MEIKDKETDIKPSNYLLIGAYIALGIGLVIGGYVLYYFLHNIDATDKMKVSDLGTILSGSVGLFWSLAGVLFFIYNLEQQKVAIELQKNELRNQIFEMQTANSTSLKQQSAIAEQTINSLFYNLLENNKKVAQSIGANKFEKLINEIEAYSRLYNEYLSSYTFTFSSTQHHPIFQVLKANSIINEMLNDYKSLIDNVLDVINFIEDNMNKKAFYHRMFFNQLTHIEKYLIGFVFYHKLFGIKLPESEFDYTVIYKKSDSFFSIDRGSFPILSLHLNYNGVKNTFRFGEKKCMMFSINIVENYLNKQLILKGVKLNLKEEREIVNNGFNSVNNYDIIIEQGLVLDATDVLKDLNLNNANPNYRHRLKLTFNFLYGDISYDVIVEQIISFALPTAGRNTVLA